MSLMECINYMSRQKRLEKAVEVAEGEDLNNLIEKMQDKSLRLAFEYGFIYGMEALQNVISDSHRISLMHEDGTFNSDPVALKIVLDSMEKKAKEEYFEKSRDFAMQQLKGGSHDK